MLTKQSMKPLKAMTRKVKSMPSPRIRCKNKHLFKRRGPTACMRLDNGCVVYSCCPIWSKIQYAGFEVEVFGASVVDVHSMYYYSLACALWKSKLVSMCMFLNMVLPVFFRTTINSIFIVFEVYQLTNEGRLGPGGIVQIIWSVGGWNLCQPQSFQQVSINVQSITWWIGCSNFMVKKFQEMYVQEKQDGHSGFVIFCLL